VIPTPTMEDYVERIHTLICEKGYARVIDIAQLLEVQSPSVTRMVQKLAEAGLVEYERYRGVVLTEAGNRLGEQMQWRHQTLERFLRVLGVEDEAVIWTDVEGIEHHVSPQTLGAIHKLVEFFQAHPDCLASLRAHEVGRAVEGGERPGPEPVEPGLAASG